MASVTVHAYRRLLRNCAQLRCSLQRHNVDSYDELVGLLHRTHSVDAARTRLPPGLFKSDDSLRDRFIRGVPDLTPSVRREFRRDGRGATDVGAAFAALRVLSVFNKLYDDVLAPRAAPGGALRIGDVAVHPAADAAEPCVVVAYDANASTADGEEVGQGPRLSGYHCLFADGTVRLCSHSTLRRSVARAPVDGLKDPNGFFVRWDTGTLRYVPNSDLAYKWQEASSTEPLEMDEGFAVDEFEPELGSACRVYADAESGAEVCVGSGSAAGGERGGMLQLFAYLLPGPPPMVVRLRRVTTMLMRLVRRTRRRLQDVWLWVLSKWLPLLPPARIALAARGGGRALLPLYQQLPTPPPTAYRPWPPCLCIA